MQPEIIISLVIPAGSQVGPFDLYSNVDGYTTPFETGINASEFLSPGYTTTPPDGATYIRVKSTGSCDTFIDLENLCQPTTTTTTSSSTSTTTTSSTSTTTSTSSTTTTTTTVPPTTTTTTSSTSTTTTTTTAPPTTTTTSTTKAPIGYDLTGSNASELDACSDSYFSTVYVEDNTVTVGNVVYTDSARTNPYPFTPGQYYKISFNGVILQGNALGEITNILECGVTPSLYISGVQSLCPDFCQNNYSIPTLKTTNTGHTFWTLAPGDIIQGATLTAGWYAYANTNTTTSAAASAGLLRMFRIVSGNSVQEISQCSDDNLSCDLQ